MTRPRTLWVVAALPLLFVGYLFVYPMARILWLGLSELQLTDLLVEKRLLRVGWFTLWQAAASTVLTLLAAAPLTWAVSRFEFPGRRLAQAVVIVPFVLPTVVVGTAFAALGWRGSIWAILAAHVFYNVAVVVRTVGGLWSRIDRKVEEAAAMLGGDRWQVFWHVTLPLLRPAIAAAASIIFLFTFTSFGVILILGGFQYATLEVEIYRQAVTLFDLPLAAALAMAQLAGISALLAVYARRQERTASPLVLASESATRRRPEGTARLGVAAAVVGTLGLMAIPPGVLLARAVSNGGFRRLVADDPVVGRPIESVPNSLWFAVAATVMAVAVGMCASYVVSRRGIRLSRWFDVVLMLPLGTSAVTIGFGFLIALDRPVDLRATTVLVPLAHSLVAVPFVVRATVPLLRSISPSVREAAAMLGASPGRVFRHVDLPIVTRAALVGAGFAFVVSLGEFGATSFIARPDTVTIPVMIFRLLGRPGTANFAAALALAAVLGALTAAAIMAIDRLRSTDLGTF
ncbi:MAG TPA: iron ABC transporter permease [Acidimicrobiia bacterium]|nr:iron ABC transporter permease [Acidimicrobiia bacterium]